VSPELTPDRWRRIKEVLGDALELPLEDRPAFLDSACVGDGDLRRRVDNLIEADGRSWTLADRADAVGAESPAAAPEGRRIGPYEIVREIGRGGMGAVYLGRRQDDFERRVAIKLIRTGLADSEALRRFLGERQIAARLEHPNIARLLDGGATPEGEPYFVMEYVEGEPLLDYCERLALPLDRRLALFQEICGAVAFAHRNLVVHRDIKPANILVTADGSPKLLDFGIAKLIDAEGRAAGGTETLYRVMTPDYASPEQVRGIPITTASDVYSLGIVLYELLTGRRPYRLETGRTEELLRVVCETEPPRPSAAVLQPRAAAAGADAGAAPGGETDSSLARKLRGDLDAITMKAIRKEPDRRYASVEQLADDLRRHRNGQPVLARRGTFSYRAGKFARRHRVGIAAAAVLVLALAGGLTATLREAARARLAESRARKRFDDVRRLANSMLFEFDDAIRDLNGSTPARRMLVEHALQYLDGLSRESAEDRSLRRELADAYQKVGDVQGNPFHPNLGDLKGALASYGKAIGLLEPAVAAAGATDDEKASLATAYLGRGGIEVASGAAPRAVADSRRGLALRVELARAAPGNARRQMELAQAWQFLAFHLQAAGSFAEAERALEQQAAILREREKAEPGSRTVRRAIEQNRYIAGTLLESLGRQQEALATLRQAAALAETLRGEDPTSTVYLRDVGYAYMDIGVVQSALGDPESALAAHRQSGDAFGELAAADRRSVDGRLGVAIGHHNVAETLLKLGRRAEALAEYRLARPGYESIVAAAPDNLWVTSMLAKLYSDLADFEPEGSPSGCSLDRRSIELFGKAGGAGDSPQHRAALETSRRRFAACGSAARS